MYQKDGMHIKFDKATYHRSFGVQKIHYVLILDRSGSMAGQPWKDLMNAV